MLEPLLESSNGSLPCRYFNLLWPAMVYYYTSNVVSPSAFIYVGKDKFESTPSIDSFLEESS